MTAFSSNRSCGSALVKGVPRLSARFASRSCGSVEFLYAPEVMRPLGLVDMVASITLDRVDRNAIVDTGSLVVPRKHFAG